MKRSILISVLILSTLLAGCGGNNPSEEELITVDVTKSYPKKELILQDFMDVEYIPLETTDEFICQGLVMAIGKDVILARNRVRDGYIFFFDRKTGKGLKKINREGQGGEEYTFIQRIVLNEEQNEMFVLDHFSRQIVVYDLDGKFKRKLKRGEELYFFHLYDFGQDDLIANNYWVTDKSAFAVVSKQDGNMIEQIQIPFKEKIPIAMSYSDEAKDLYYSVIPNNYNPIIPYFDSWMLVEQSSDTIYKYQSDHKMIPIIARTPSVQSMNPEVFLFLGVLTNRYYFMETVKKEYNFETHEGFPTTDLLYDKQEQAIFEYTV
ncbi:6-bladed beta-propeller, partial [Parabacteroides sp.]